MSGPQVRTTLTIVGRDEASRVVADVETSARGLTDQLVAAQERATGLTGALRQVASGDRVVADVETSARGLTDQLVAAQERATGLTGALRQVASGDVLGGMTSLQGALGVSGVAGAAVGATAAIAGVAAAVAGAAVKTTEWSAEIESLRAQMVFAFAGGEHEALAVARAIGGVAVESVVALQTTLRQSGAEGEISVKQLQALANAATTMGKSGDDALRAFADALRTGSTEGLTQIGVMVRGKSAIAAYAREVGKSTDALSAAERAQVILTAVQAEAARVQQGWTAISGRQGDALSELGNRWTELKLVISDLVAGPAVRVVEAMISIVNGVGGAQTALIALGRLAVAPTIAIIGALSKAVEAAGAAMRGDLSAAARLAGESIMATTAPIVDSIRDIYKLSEAAETYGEQARAAAGYTAASGVAASATSGRIGGLATAFDEFSAAAAKAVEAQQRFAAADAAEQSRRAAAARADAARRRAAAAALRQRQGAEFMAAVDAPNDRGLEIARAEVAAQRELAQVTAQYQDRVLAARAAVASDPAQAALLEQRRIEIQLARELAQVQEQLYLTSAQQAEVSAALQVEASMRIAAAQREVSLAAAQQVQSWAQAGQAVAAALGEGDAAQRVSAGLSAIIAGADAFRHAAEGNIPGAIASGAAAVGYARAALTPAPARPSGSSAPAATPAPTPAASSGGKGGGVTIHLHGIATTRAEVGVGIAKALHAASGTGMVPA